MNVQCAWRMLVECRCGRLQQQKMFVTLSMEIIMCDDIQHLYKIKCSNYYNMVAH